MTYGLRVEKLTSVGFDDVENPPDAEMMIHVFRDGRYGVMVKGVWQPGFYADLVTALRSFYFKKEVLRELSVASAFRHGENQNRITRSDLDRAAAKGEQQSWSTA